MDASALSMHIADTPEKIGEGSGFRPSFVGFPFPFPIPPENRRVSARTLTTAEAEVCKNLLLLAIGGFQHYSAVSQLRPRSLMCLVNPGKSA